MTAAILEALNGQAFNMFFATSQKNDVYQSALQELKTQFGSSRTLGHVLVIYPRYHSFSEDIRDVTILYENFRMLELGAKLLENSTPDQTMIAMAQAVTAGENVKKVFAALPPDATIGYCIQQLKNFFKSRAKARARTTQIELRPRMVAAVATANKRNKRWTPSYNKKEKKPSFKRCKIQDNRPRKEYEEYLTQVKKVNQLPLTCCDFF